MGGRVLYGLVRQGEFVATIQMKESCRSRLHLRSSFSKVQVERVYCDACMVLLNLDTFSVQACVQLLYFLLACKLQ